MITDSSLDVDWFAQDIGGNLIHFASGGGKLPLLVKERDNDLLRTFFHQLPNKSVDVDYSINLPKFVSYASVDFQVYTSDFRKMSQRGLYSFDKSNLGDPLDTKYHLVCAPKVRILVDEIPSHIKNQLIKIEFLIDGLSEVDISNYV